jgi:hypothetical protein
MRVPPCSRAAKAHKTMRQKPRDMGTFSLYPDWDMLGHVQVSRTVFLLLSLSWTKRLAYTGGVRQTL